MLIKLGKETVDSDKIKYIHEYNNHHYGSIAPGPDYLTVVMMNNHHRHFDDVSYEEAYNLAQIIDTRNLNNLLSVIPSVTIKGVTINPVEIDEINVYCDTQIDVHITMKEHIAPLVISDVTIEEAQRIMITVERMMNIVDRAKKGKQ